MKCIKGVTNHVISSIKGITLSKLFVIKKNVNSTKDYGFEKSNDKCFFCNLLWIKLSGNVLETD